MKARKPPAKHESISLDILSEPDVEVIPLIEIQGVKFSSKSFQLEIGLRQIMVIKKKRMFENCMIKLNKVEESVPVEPVVEAHNQHPLLAPAQPIQHLS